MTPTNLWRWRWWRAPGLSVYLLPTESETALPLDEARGVLDPEETARAARFMEAIHAERWMRSRAWLKLLLSAARNVAPDSLRWNLGPQGKPSWSTEPTLHFNLSHSGSWCAIALSDHFPVGIDVEVTDPHAATFWEEVALNFFPDQETKWLREAPDPIARFYEFWTAKEAVMKLTGLGMNLEPKDIHLAPDLRSATWPGPSIALRSWAPAPGVRLAMAWTSER
jgi:4'-phosphopantetheinyl transferase